MRNKIKQMMKKEDGFTLVELLAVIVILGIIVAIAIPAVGNIIERAQSDANDSEIALIEDAARIYFTTEDDPDNPVDVSKLVTEGYLELRDSNATGSVGRSGGDGDPFVYTYTGNLTSAE